MRNIVFVGGLAAAFFYAWMWVWTVYIPDKEAQNWVEELRLGIDRGHIQKSFSWSPPLPPEVFTLPPDGISQTFTVKRTGGPGFFDYDADSRQIHYEAKFTASDMVPRASGRDYAYRLILNDEGNYLLPKWDAAEFHPVGKKIRRR